MTQLFPRDDFVGKQQPTRYYTINPRGYHGLSRDPSRGPDRTRPFLDVHCRDVPFPALSADSAPARSVLSARNGNSADEFRVDLLHGDTDPP